MKRKIIHVVNPAIPPLETIPKYYSTRRRHGYTTISSLYRSFKGFIGVLVLSLHDAC